MVKRKVVDVIEFLRKCLNATGLNISKIILFGSQSQKNAATMESDIDIAIVSEDFRDKGIFERAKLTKEAEIRTIRKFMVPLDIVTLTSEEFENKSSVIAGYVRKGKIIPAA